MSREYDKTIPRKDYRDFAAIVSAHPCNQQKDKTIHCFVSIPKENWKEFCEYNELNPEERSQRIGPLYVITRE